MTADASEAQQQQDGQVPPAAEPVPAPVPVEKFMGVIALIAAVGLAAMALDLMGVPVFRLLGLGPAVEGE